MNILQIIARKTIKFSFDTSVSIMTYFSSMEKYHKQLDVLRKLERGTLGKEIANCLDKNHLTLVPKFESHDLKHVLLDYKMTPEDEIRMQAFMIGNGNYSVPSFTIFIFGAILLPDLWSTFYTDYKNGRNTVPISNWSIESCAKRNLQELRLELSEINRIRKRIFSLKRFTKIAALTTIGAGIFGMLYCLPYLFSSNLADLVGAGFPFLGGSLLVVGGLLTLATLSRKKTIPIN